MFTIIYHKDCYDGFGAAWVANRELSAYTREFIPCAYGDPVPAITNSDVYILDFSFPKPVMEKFKAENKSVVCLDHHKTAQASLEGLDWCEFDMNRSGAGMTWDHFHEESRPDLINYIEDRDLWRFALSKSREIHAYISSFPKDFATWDKLNMDLIYHYADCVYAGEAILRYYDQKVQELAQHAIIRDVAGYKVPVVNCPYLFASDVLHVLCDKYPDSPFAAGWSETTDGVKRYSLRGRSTDDFDVSEIAKRFGGGGHRKAAGYEEPMGLSRG